jgi:hypothetical protein
MLWRNRSHHAVKQEAQPELLSSPLKDSIEILREDLQKVNNNY